MVVNLENAFRFPFKDGKWVIKILIGGALFFIPIIGWFVLGGYLLKILADAKDKKEPSLPEWNDWGVLFQEGFMMCIVVLCYVIVPHIILSIFGRIPIIGCLVIPMQFILGFLLYPASVVGLCLYLDKKELAAAFDIKTVIEKFKVNLADYLIISLVTGVLCTISVITLVFAVFIWFYLSVVGFRLYGEAYSSQKTA